MIPTMDLPPPLPSPLPPALLPDPSPGRKPRPPARERASSMVEYIGLGAISATLVSGIAAAIDSAAGDRLGAAIARRLLAAISGVE
jgi:hypothetical protein